MPLAVFKPIQIRYQRYVKYVRTVNYPPYQTYALYYLPHRNARKPRIAQDRGFRVGI